MAAIQGLNKRRTDDTHKLVDTLGQKIMKSCYEMYNEPHWGLLEISKELRIDISAPRRKINILIIGNHSVGKSSFINWYIGEHVLKTGVAIETQGFNFVVHGNKRDTLSKETTLRLLPYLDFLRDKKGAVDYVTCEVSTSRERDFPLVTFIDTPGLVDGAMVYPFNVNEVLVSLANIADLILVFFDPVGQALCKRTLDVTEELNNLYPEKIKFYLSKADDAGHETDRQRVMIQIVQELCKRPGLNKQGLDMPVIYIPNPNKPSKCVNQIENLCADIQKTINLSVQNSLQKLETDSLNLASILNDLILVGRGNKRYNIWYYVIRNLLLFWSLLSLPLLFVQFRDRFVNISQRLFGMYLGSLLAELRLSLGSIIGLWILMAFLFKFCFTSKPRLESNKHKKMLDFINRAVLPQKESLLKEYLDALSGGDYNYF